MKYHQNRDLRVLVYGLNVVSLPGIDNLTEVNNELLDDLGHCVLCILRCTVSTVSFIFGIESWISSGSFIDFSGFVRVVLIRIK